MSTLVELTSAIIASQAASKSMSIEELLKSIQLVHASLKALESGESIPTEVSVPTEAPKLTIKQSFKKDSVTCMVCGKSGFKTLTRHLSKEHQLKPSQYRKQFNIPSSQSLTAKSYSESRRKMAIDMNLGAGLEKARATRKANTDKKNASVPAPKLEAPVPMKRTKAPVPMKVEATKAQVSAVNKKTNVPAKVEATKAPVKAKKAVAPVKTAKKK